MSNQNQPHNTLEMDSAPDETINIVKLKDSIIEQIQDADSQHLLEEIQALLQRQILEKEQANGPLKLSRHINSIFNQYPETLSKLAQ